MLQTLLQSECGPWLSVGEYNASGIVWLALRCLHRETEYTGIKVSAVNIKVWGESPTYSLPTHPELPGMFCSHESKSSNLQGNIPGNCMSSKLGIILNLQLVWFSRLSSDHAVTCLDCVFPQKIKSKQLWEKVH